ncbi:MAG: hypothetical protein V4510_00010 [bacterium]
MALHVPMAEVQLWQSRPKPAENGAETVVILLPSEESFARQLAEMRTKAK